MGIQDRDYYKEWWRKREGYVERAAFRLPANHKPLKSRVWAFLTFGSHWHWSLKVVAAMVYLGIGFGIRRWLAS